MNFRKLISNLPFNPSLVSQVAFYGRRVREESSVRRAGFSFVALAMIVQMFAVIAPPQVSLAGSNSNIIQGPFQQTQAGILARYDTSPWLQAVYSHYNISRDDILKMTPSAIDKAADAAAGQRNLITAGRAAHTPYDPSVTIVSSEYTAPIYEHSINLTYKSDNLIPVLYCPREVCGAIKMIILACGNPVIDLNEPKKTPQQPIGYFSNGDCNIVIGWAWNGSHDRYVHFYVDKPAFSGAIKDKDYYEVVANQSRPDVPLQLPQIPAEVGYSWDGGPLRNDGHAHQVWVYVTDRGDNYLLLSGGEGATVNFNCPKTTPQQTPMCTVPGKTNLPADSPDCVEPTASCDLLGSTNSEYQVNTPVTYYGRATASNGATISSYDIDFGDNNGKLTSYSSPNAFTHTYKTVGAYTVKLYVQTSLGQKTSTACTKDITITPTPVPCPSKPDILQTDKNCKPCVENPDVQEDHPSCIAIIVRQKKVSNPTQKITDFNGKTANQNDILEYTLLTTNVSKKITAKDVVVQEAVTDLLDYADIADLHGGTLNETSRVVSWPKEDIFAGKTSTHLLTIKVKAIIPATPVSSTDSGTFDLKMINVYGDTITVNLPCVGAKCVETVTSSLPNTGPGTSAALGFVITMVVGYFFARSRLLARELELIKQDYAPNGGF